jgi:hypothetical protein
MPNSLGTFPEPGRTRTSKPLLNPEMLYRRLSMTRVAQYTGGVACHRFARPESLDVSRTFRKRKRRTPQPGPALSACGC